MRNSLILGLILIGFLLGGFFSVDQRELGMVSFSSNKPIQSYPPGLHWKVPFYGELSYVYTNQRSSYIAMNQALSVEAGQAFTSKVVVNWQVSQAESYLQYLNKNSVKVFDSELSQAVLTKLSTLAVNSKSNLDFQGNVEQLKNWSLTNLGIKIINLQIVSLNTVVAPTILPQGKLSNSNLLSPESSYVAAQQIKTQADSTQRTELANLRASDPQFFDYFIKVHNLGESAQSKQGIPTLTQLYN